MELVETTPPTGDLAQAMQQFILDQAEGRTEETRQRYAQVADDLVVFVASVDAEPWLGPELAAYLERERVRIGGDALLTSLGLASFIRILPAFLTAPWLPPPGATRRTRRTVVRRLMTFLRLRAHQQGCMRREDFKVISQAVGHGYSNDHADPRTGRTGTVTCSVTLHLIEHLVDRLLAEVEQGHHESLDEAIAARINPVQRTVWEEPGYSDEYRHGW